MYDTGATDDWAAASHDDGGVQQQAFDEVAAAGKEG